MNRQMYLNIAIKDLNQTVDFFTKLGFTFDARFTDENATAMIVSPDITVMLLIEKFFKTFTTKDVADTSKTASAIIGIRVESREKVDEMLQKAIEAGGKKSNETYDYGWMYGSSFEDINGHLWEFIYIDENSDQNPVNS